MDKWRRKLPKWSRKWKTVRNLLCIVLLLFLMSWEMEFPSLTKAGLIRRAERQYLLEDSQLLFTGHEEGKSDFWKGTLYVRNGDLFLTVNYDRTPLGLQKGFSYAYEEPDGILCLSRTWWPLEVLAVGALETADRAELEITIHWDGEFGGRRWDTERTYTAEGERQNDDCFTFRLTPCYSEDDSSPEAKMERAFFGGGGPVFTQAPVLRLYDAAGELLHEKTMEYIEIDVGAF